MSEPGNRFKRLPMNTRGRDFIIGDVHGAFDLVIHGMRMVKFDPNIDRLFVVGDLIDRGPGSHRALKFLTMPYVHAVKGNHEADFCEIDPSGLRILGQANWNGLGWVVDTPDADLLAMQRAFAALPIAIEVETPRGTVGIVHADVPAGMDWGTFIHAIEKGDPGVIETALTGRDRIKSRDCAGVEGVGRLFVGHTIQWNGPQQFGNVFTIDTGAVFRELDKDRGSLTMVNMICSTGVLVPSSSSSSVFAHSDEGEGEFGNYVQEREVRQRP